MKQVIFVLIFASVVCCQTTLRAVTIQQEPFIFYDSTQQGNNRFEGFMVDLFNYALKEGNINATYEMYLVPDGAFGSPSSEGNWTGVIGELTNGEADVALAPLTITSQRITAVDFTSAYLDIGLKILIQKPDETRDAAGFLQPFHWTLWLLLVIIVFVISAISFIIDYFSPYGHRRMENPEEDAKQTYQESLLGSLLIFVGQGGDVPKSWSSRILILTYFFFTLIIISSYTANLTAFLTIRRLDTEITSLDTLRQSQGLFAVVANSAPESWFKTNQKLEIQAMLKNLRSYETTDAAVAALRTGAVVAFIHTSSILDYIANQEPCETLQVGDLFGKGNFGIALPVGSPYVEPLSMAILKLRESGFIEDLYKKWYYDMGACTSSTSDLGDDQSTLYIADMAGLFYMLLVFVGVAICALLFELWFYKFRVKDQIVDRLSRQPKETIELNSVSH